MARKAHIIDQATDAWGSEWDVREARPTKHGFDVLIGWHKGCRGKGYGGPQTILTTPLVEHMERHRYDFAWDLPLGNTTIKRIRRVLGHHRYLDAAEWWAERIDDLSNLTLEEFAAKHDRKISTIERARLALLGRTLRPAYWWREDATASLILSDRSPAYIADKLGIALSSVRRLRMMLLDDLTRPASKDKP